MGDESLVTKWWKIAGCSTLLYGIFVGSLLTAVIGLVLSDCNPRQGRLDDACYPTVGRFVDDLPHCATKDGWELIEFPVEEN